MAVITRVGTDCLLEGVLERETVHDGREHADVVAGRAVHATRRGGQTAEDVATADHDANLDALIVDVLDLVRDERAERRIDTVRPVAQQRLAGELEQDPAEPDTAAVGHHGGCRIAHRSSPRA